MSDINHAERAHSKFSASGSERWLKCAASVALEEASPPSKDSVWSLEGTKAHEVLEKFLTRKDWGNLISELESDFAVDEVMIGHCKGTALRVLKLQKLWNAPLLVEKKIFNSFIHAEMFGTCDVIIPVYGDVLHIMDFKYGAGQIVDPTENTQLIQYALGAAESYDWNFKTVSMHILQPRAGKEFHRQWSITIDELRNKWLPLWFKGVARVESGKSKPFEGGHCYWCRAKDLCELKVEKRFKEVTKRFGPLESEVQNGKEENRSKKGFKQNAFRKEGATESKTKGRQKSSEDFKAHQENDEAEKDFY